NPTAIIMNQAMGRRFAAGLRPNGSTPAVLGGLIEGLGRDEAGRRLMAYDGIPIILVDGNRDLYDALPFDEGSGSATSIYVVSLREGGLFGIQSEAPDVRDMGELQTTPSFRTRLEWFAGIAAA